MAPKPKMRKLDLSFYKVEIMDDKTQKPVEKDYDTIWSLRSWLTAHPLGLNGKELIRNSDLGEKIKNAKDSVLLTEDEYIIILNVVNTLKGFGKTDDVLLRRIYDCPEVPVEESGKKKGKSR